MKIAISVPDRVSRAADQAARHLRIPRSQFYARAVEAYLRDQGRADVTEKLNAVYGGKAGSPDRAVLEQGIETLRRTEWNE
ncbi:MAG: ChpI protein [Acidobacteria bacterium]|nr:MAG: ChpI protein [Acidobacteriota bacterium]